MKSLHSFITEDSDIFGPGTDLVISLTAILIILIAVTNHSFNKKLVEKDGDLMKKNIELIEKNKTIENYKNEIMFIKHEYRTCKNEIEVCYDKLEKNGIGKFDISEVESNQKEIIRNIADNYKTQPNRINPNEYGISTNRKNNNDILIYNDLKRQKISFSSHILFESDNTKLKENGKDILTVVGNIFKEKLPKIEEIQIEGHADIRKSSKFSSNLKLAGDRAIEVFKHLQNLGINPENHIMSATSFGEYKPVQRQIIDTSYNKQKLKEDNDTEEKMSNNRRIEIVLIYRRQ